MISRYTRPEMGTLWSDARRYELWLEVELAMLDSREARGSVPPGTGAALRLALQDKPISAARVDEIEATTRHDVIAFLTAVAEQAGPPARFLHWGMTSSDLLDTALALQLRQAGLLLQRGVADLLDALRDRALEHRDTPMAGRTHGMHAEPVTLGLKLLNFYDALRRDQERLEVAIQRVSCGKFSGAVGTLAQLTPELEADACMRLGIFPVAVATQVIARDRHAEFLTTLALAGTTLERIALEIRHLQRSEVAELEEPFGKGQKGSSAMPHKRNPIVSERICGLARLLRGNACVGLENVALWHERDISHSSAERVILPDSCIALDYALDLATRLVRDMVVRADRMRANLESSRGLVYSEGVLLALVDSGLTREEAYVLVQRAAHGSLEDGRTFLDHLRGVPEVTARIPRERLEALLDLRHSLRHVHVFFERVLGA